MTAPLAARWITRLVCGAVPLLILAALAVSASAHTELIDSTPADREASQVMPQQVVLTFSEAIAPEFAVVSAQREGETGQPTRLDVSVVGPRVIANVPAPTRSAARAGTWIVAYRVTSADGHPIQGQVSFRLRPPVSETPTSTTPSPTLPAEPSASETLSAAENDEANSGPSRSDDGIVPVSLLVIGGMAAAGVAGVLLLWGRRREDGVEP